MIEPSQYRNLGQQGLRVSPIGLGCMGMSEFYGAHDEAASLKTLAQAVELGVNFWDSSDIYGPFTNEQLLGRYLAANPSHRESIVLATKFGIKRSNKGDFLGLSGRPEYVKEACDASLKRLGVDHIDLYYQHRMDPNVPIEETVGAMGELVQAGKVRYLGLSEAGAQTLERAHKTHPISALQSEYSLWSRDIEDEILPKCQQLGIGLVAYSPLGRGFLTGAYKSLEDFSSDDWRLGNPRFEAQNFANNLVIVDQLSALAADKGCSPAQLALAWIKQASPDYVSIPGTRQIKRLQENAAAVAIELSPAELENIDKVFTSNPIAGERYPKPGMAMLGL